MKILCGYRDGVSERVSTEERVSFQSKKNTLVSSSGTVGPCFQCLHSCSLQLEWVDSSLVIPLC